MNSVIIDDVTIIIKTFERKDSLIRLLNSVQKSRYQCDILIADDSATPYEVEILNKFPDMKIKYLVLPFDSGLSKGRNYLINNVMTDYFLLCDDDFCFEKRTNIETAKEIMNQYELDIISGCLYNFYSINSKIGVVFSKIQHFFSYGFLQTYVGAIEMYEPNTVKVHIKTRVKKKFVKADIVHNFFLGNTKRILEIGGWDDKLKLSEHGEFFLRAKKCGIKTGHSSKWGIRHYPESSSNYLQYKNREYMPIVMKRHNLVAWIDEIDNGSTFVREMHEGTVITKRIFHKTIRGFLRKTYSVIKNRSESRAK